MNIALAALSVPLLIAANRCGRQAEALGDCLGGDDLSTKNAVLVFLGLGCAFAAGARWLLGVS